MPKDFIPFEHPQFAIGSIVYIDPSIRDIHPQSPIAGQSLEVCQGSYYPLLEAIEGDRHTTRVPVIWQDTIFYAEQEYVKERRDVRDGNTI